MKKIIKKCPRCKGKGFVKIYQPQKIKKKSKWHLLICPVCGRRFYYSETVSNHAELYHHTGNYNP